MAVTVAPAPKTNEGDAPPAPQPSFDKSKITNVSSAAEQLVNAGLFAKEFPAEAEAAEDAPAADDEIRSGETRTDGTEGETPPSDQSDASPLEPETPAIEAPVSWTADEKDEFAKLPPQAQQAIVRRESERERVISTRLQEAADRTKQLDVQLQQAATERAQQSQMLRGVLLQLNPEIVRFQNVDWDRLAVDNPAEWAKQRQAFDSLQTRANIAGAQLQVLDQQQRQEQGARFQQYLNDEKHKLISKMPDFADPVKATAIARDLSQYLVGLGFNEQEVGSIADHRMLMVAHAAMTASKQAQALKAAQAKKVSPGKVVQLRPGTKAPGGATEEAEAAKARSLRDTMRKTGKLDDVAAFLQGTGAVR